MLQHAGKLQGSKMIELLKRLSETNGQSGNEKEVREIIRSEIKPYVDELYIDKFGNLIARHKGKGPTIMLAAHMDEIGIMIKSIDTDGKLYVSPIGGLEPMTMLGEQVHVMTKDGKEIEGIITTRDLQEGAELSKLPTIEEIYIDVGMSSAENVGKTGIRIGSYVNIVKNFVPLGDGKGSLITGKALDDRIGCYALIELAKSLRKSKAEIYYVFTVQEEIGLHGAKTSIYSINPDYAIVLDMTESDDAKHPSIGKSLSKGPVLVIKDAEMITTSCINEWIINISKKHKIPIQPDVSDYGTTDALNVSVSKGGIPCTVIGVAVRNIHSTTSIACLNDIKNAIKILEILLSSPPRICY